MKFCCEYWGDTAKTEYFDEIIVQITPDYEIDNIQEFFDKHKTNIIVMQIMDSENFREKEYLNKIINLIPPTDYKYKFKLVNPYAAETRILAQDMAYAEVQYFFDVLVDNWDLLNSVIELEPCEVYIANAFGFELQDIYDYINPMGIGIRVYPNIAQAVVGSVDSLTKFWIRPDDIDYYDTVVDVYEFFVPIQNNAAKDFYFHLYAEDCHYEGKLSDIIAGLEEDVMSNALLNVFAPKRINCHKKCAKGKCDYCYRLARVSELISEEDYAVHYKPSELRQTAWSRLSEEGQEKIKKSVLDKIEKK